MAFGLGFGLALGAVVVGGFEFMDDRLHSEKEIKALLPMKVISEIPEVLTPSDERRSRKRMLLEVGHGCAGICRHPGGVCVQLSTQLGFRFPMYKAFFNLTRNPFELTPDPAFLFSTKRHNEALAALYYGVRQHKGFVVVTGEVGTGKTLLLRCLLRLLKQSKDVAYAYLFNSRLSPTEFLQYILSDFGLPASGKNKGELLLDLSQFLVSRGSKKLTTVLIVDEAHHLSADILEEVRLSDEPGDEPRTSCFKSYWWVSRNLTRNWIRSGSDS